MARKILLALLMITLVGSVLRLWNLSVMPVSLFGDELDVGYQAYSILKTGKDYSGNSWPIHFQSLAEWRTPLYLYSAVPTVALFGISPLGVRLPAALFGTLTIPLIFYLVLELTRSEKQSTGNKTVALLAAFFLAVSPWHIQYSRAAFEVTELLFFLIAGVFLTLRAFRTKGASLWMAGFCFALLPWIYSTAKLFTPFFLLIMAFVYWKQLFKLPRKALFIAGVVAFVVGAPITWDTLFGGGTARFNYISVFSDPTVEPEIGTARQNDAHLRGETGSGLRPTTVDRLFHNKFTYWGDAILKNYFMPLSSDFLFISGDPNPRHSIEGMGMFYKFEIIGLIAGIILFVSTSIDRKVKYLIACWILLGLVPSSLTRDGGNHATRLILILPPLVVLISYGFYEFVSRAKKSYRSVCISALVALFMLSFASYEHLYWVHNPTQSERWWHFGWKDAVQAVRSVESEYDQVIITSADEPPYIFFAAWYEYDPSQWHQGYPFAKHVVQGFGESSFIGKFSFASPADKKGLYDWGKILTPKMLYLASAKEVNVNLVQEPNRLPSDLRLIKSVVYPSGEPAFYLFTHAAQ